MEPRFTKTLRFRLFVLILLVSVIVFVSISYLMIHLANSHLMEEIFFSALRTNDLIERSIHYSMLENKKEDVARIIKTLGEGTGVEGIRIYSKTGTVVFSTLDEDIGKAADMQAEQCTVCHKSARPLEHLPESTRPRTFRTADGHRVLAVITPIYNEESCAEPGCHPRPGTQKVLGIIDTKMSLEHVDLTLGACRSRLVIMFVIGIVLLEVSGGIFIWKMILKRLKNLDDGTRKVMKGILDFSIDEKGSDEITNLSHSFNQMIVDLKKAQNESREWSRTLEEKVEQKTLELRQTQDQMVHVAKMASLGKMAASIAHEINNPLSGVLTYIKLLQKRLSTVSLTGTDQDTFMEQLDLVIHEIKRCGNIVKSMLHFSAGTDSRYEEVNVHEIIERSLIIINHQLETNEISKVLELRAKNPVFTGNGNQIQQTLISLFMNAVEAMDKGGTLSIKTADDAGKNAIIISVRDNGRGMSQEVQSSIFEPFFTTKEETSGVGLGLSIAYGIIRSHQGTISVESAPGAGTTFTIVLPRQGICNNEKSET